MNNFDDYYQSEIFPEVNKFENFRKSCLLKNRILKLSLLSSIIIYVLILKTFFSDLFHESFLSFIHPYYTSVKTYNYLLQITGIFLAISAFLIYKLKSFQEEFSYLSKSELYRKIIGFFPNLYYRPFTEIDPSIVVNSMLFKNFDYIESEDYISGVYKGVSLELSEIRLTKIIKTTQNINNIEVPVEREKEIFKGIFFISSMNKKFSSNTYVLADRWIKIFNGLPSELERVALEDPVFENKFDVYSDDQIEARYLLTTAFMERIIELSNLMNLSCCFIDNKFIIALDCEKDFLPNLSLKEPITYEIVQKIVNEVSMLFNIIDILKLDLNIGL